MVRNSEFKQSINSENLQNCKNENDATLSLIHVFEVSSTVYSDCSEHYRENKVIINHPFDLIFVYFKH